jgi:hypothetical protein
MMKDDHNSTKEPFFWIKTGRDSDVTPYQKKEKAETEGKRAVVPRGQSLPPDMSLNNKETVRAGLQPGWIRASFIVREKYLKQLKEKAYWDRRAIKDILDEILEAGLKHKNSIQ